MTIAVKPLTGALGAEIIGADLRREADFSAIRQAFIDHSVIAIRGQELAPEDQLAFARRWGAINVNRFFAAVPEYPEIAVVLKEPDQTAAIGEDWHTDHSYDQIPAMGSILYALETPAVGGDTMFASMAAAYDALSEGLKATLGRLRAWHSSRHAFGAVVVDAETSQDGRIGNAAAATPGCAASDGDLPPAVGSQGAVCEPGFHHPYRRLEQGGECGSAGIPLCPLRQA
jgi:taurine dioxygenase